MKICKVCLQSDILCSACAKKIESGAIKKLEVEMSRALFKAGKESGQEVDFVEAFENGGKVFVIVESRYAGRFIGPGGRTIKKLSEAIGRPIKMLEKAEGTEKHVIEKLIAAPVLGINKVYSQDGESIKVRIERKYSRNIDPLRNIASGVLGKKISFVYE